MLSTLARFAEEQFRGEAQTKHYAGLSIYQWLAIGCYIFGIGVSMFGVALTKPSTPGLDASGIVLALVAGLVAAFSMSVDFPVSTKRFSRLTVK